MRQYGWRLWNLLTLMNQRFWDDRILQIAGSLTFTTLLAVVPVATVAVSLATHGVKGTEDWPRPGDASGTAHARASAEYEVQGALALAKPTVIGLWHDLGSIVTPALLLPTLLASRPALPASTRRSTT